MRARSEEFKPQQLGAESGPQLGPEAESLAALCATSRAHGGLFLDVLSTLICDLVCGGKSEGP